MDRSLRLALGLATLLAGSTVPAIAEEPGAAKPLDSRASAKTSTERAGDADRTRAAEAAGGDRAGRRRELTTLEKRIFVLGLAASQKN